MEPPVLLPNTEVKHSSGDDTLRGKVASRQHRVFDTNFASGTQKFPPEADQPLAES